MLPSSTEEIKNGRKRQRKDGSWFGNRAHLEAFKRETIAAQMAENYRLSERDGVVVGKSVKIQTCGHCWKIEICARNIEQCLFAC